MTRSLTVRNVFILALIACAAMFAMFLVPNQAHAAAVTISAATTSSNNASTTLAKVGDDVTVGLSLSGTPAATNTPKINIFNMGTTSMSGSGTTWFYSTTSTSVWTQGYLSWYVAWSGTLGEATSTFATSSLTSANVRFDKTAPLFSTSTSATCTGASSVCKVGDTITFTVTPTETEYGATVTGSYNGRSLTWSSSNSGITYTATYTVTEGDTDRASALQMTNLVMTDAAGNVSATGATTDVTATIDATSPATTTASPAAGRFSGSQQVTLSSTGSNTIRYTTDGTAPTCSTGTLYSTAITVSQTETINAIGCDTAGNTSAAASFEYTRRSSGGGGSSVVSNGITNPTSTAPGIVAKRLASNQIQSILSLLTSFGAPQSVIDNVSVTLSGQKPSVPSAAAMIILTRNLTVGSTGEDVQKLQGFLNARGYVVASEGPGAPGSETTLFGAKTRAALAKFQKDKGISATGFLGPLTRAAIGNMSQ